MAVGDFLFGSKPKVSTQSLGTLTPEQEQLFREFLGQLEVTPSTAGLERTSLAGLEQQAMNLVGGGPSGAETTADQTLQRQLTQGPAEFDAFFQSAIQDPLVRQFNEEILPQISRKFAPSGFFSSERLRADDRAREDLIQNLVSARAATGFDAFQQAQQNQLTALGLVPGLEGLRFDELEQLEALFGVGSGTGSQRLGLMLAALGIPMKENIATVSPGSSGFLGGIAGGIGEGLGDLLGSLF